MRLPKPTRSQDGIQRFTISIGYRIGIDSIHNHMYYHAYNNGDYWNVIKNPDKSRATRRAAVINMIKYELMGDISNKDMIIDNQELYEFTRDLSVSLFPELVNSNETEV